MTMVERWKTFSTFGKVLGWIAGAIVTLGSAWGVLWVAYSHFTTDLEAAQKHNVIIAQATQMHDQIFQEVHEHEAQDQRIQQENILANKRAQIADANRQITQLNFMLLDSTLSDEQRAFLNNSIKATEDLISCIRTDESLCE